VWFESTAKRAKAVGRHEQALEYYRRLVGLLDDEALRKEKLRAGTVTGVRNLPLPALLTKKEQWVDEVAEYLKAIGRGTEES